MASLTRREKQRCPTAGRYLTADAPRCKSSRFFSGTVSDTVLHQDCHSTERPSPEGAGSNTDPYRAMCPKMEVPSRGSLAGTHHSSGGAVRPSGFGTVGTPVVGSWSLRKSDGKVICEHCTATVAALKKQAQSFVIPQYRSCKDSALFAYLHNKLQAHSCTIATAVDEDQCPCDVCGAHLSQLKQEAIHLVIAREERTKWASRTAPSSPHLSASSRSHCSLAKPSAGSGTTAPPGPANAHLSGSNRTQSPQRSHPRGAVKPTTAEMNRWVVEQQQIETSGNDRVAILPYQLSEFSERQNENVLVQRSLFPEALSFLFRAAQKLSLASRRKNPPPAQSSVCSAPVSPCYRAIIQRKPPRVPGCLIKAANGVTDCCVGKVKVVLRVLPSPSSSRSQSPSPILRVDPTKKKVTVMDPAAVQSRQSYPRSAQPHGGQTKTWKTYSFDTAFPQESTQSEVCVGVLPDVIRSVVNGADECIICFGHGESGKSQTMLGSDKNSQSLGVIPCAIWWLYSHIERRVRTTPSLAVSISAMEVCEEDETLRDLLSGNIQNNQSADLYEDPIYGTQLRNLSVVSAPDAERAALLLDTAVASSRKCDIHTPSSSSSSYLFFTIHVQQLLSEGGGKVPEGHSRLIMIDLVKGNCDSRSGRSESDFGSVILALLNNGNKNIPNRDRKVTMLLQESLGNMNCRKTVMAHVTDSPEYFSETLCTVQIASRIRRTQKKPKHQSLSREKRGGTQSFTLRAFHSTGAVDSDCGLPHLRVGGDLQDNVTSSNQSCDTVIHVNTDGSVLQTEAALNQGIQREVTPIAPSLQQNNPEALSEEAELSSLQQQLLQHLLKIIPRPDRERKKKESVIREHLQLLRSTVEEAGQYERDLSLECNTFAELQERLGCIDGREAFKSSLKEPSSKAESLPASQDGPGTVLPASQDGPGNPEAEEKTWRLKPLNAIMTSSRLSVVCEKEDDGALLREDSGLYDCEEASAAGSNEDQANPSGTITLHPACQSHSLPECRNLSQRSGQIIPVSGVRPPVPLSPLQLPLETSGYPGRSESRTSPVGKSSSISPSLLLSVFPHSSDTSSLATNILLGEKILPQLSAAESDVKEMKATITVTVQQPLDETGEDELVFTMVEEVTISGAMERGGQTGNVIRIREAHSFSGQASSGSVLVSTPIRIIGNVSEDPASTIGSNINDMSPASTSQTMAVQVETKPKAKSSLSRENQLLPSFINPSLSDVSWGSCLEESNHHTGVSSTWLREAKASSSCGTHVWEEGGCYEMMSSGSRSNGKYGNQADRSCPRGQGVAICSPVCYNDDLPVVTALITPKTSRDCNERSKQSPETRIHGDPQATHLRTASVPRENVDMHEGYSWMRDQPKNKEQDITSSTRGSPGATLERRPSSVKHGISSDKETVPHPLTTTRKYSLDQQQRQRTRNCPLSTASSSPMEHMPSNINVRHDNMSSGCKLKSPIEESSRLFSAKLEQLANRTNSLSRISIDFKSLDRDSSQSSVSSKGSSKGSKGSWEEESSYPTLPRASRSPRKAHRSIPLTDSSPNRAHSTNSNRRSSSTTDPSLANRDRSPRTSQSKQSAVGKLMMASPKVRKVSSPSTKNLSSSTKMLRQSIYRSASLSPDGRSAVYSSPWSTQSLNRNHTQPPQTQLPLHSQKFPSRVINARVSELLPSGREPSALRGVSRGQDPDKMAESARASTGEAHLAPSPYSKVTAPRKPSHLSDHASDVTSVLSGELPPAMGKTTLLTNRNSVVSSGYESMVRDSEATGSSTSIRDCVSDQSWSVINMERSRRNPRRKSSNGSNPRRLSNDTTMSLKRSASGPRSRWVDRSIPEAYEIKVYEIDEAERLQRRGLAGKQGVACFSAKLKFLEHRQERMEELRAKYNSLKRELELAKENLMLVPGKWNQEFDLWQTFEVDSLEHLEALEVVTAKLESRVNLCKANVMIVTCFDVPTKRRQARRRRRTGQVQGFLGI
ncbi:hypothetical protein DPEC_G00088650 [Dallia pectoralis]|uniref:Uncharacterized protein n=1 Tax=Dallia pectoralis TaxID=75939 RepID=A0ACC2H0B9_DALPE|nr:hypothetical protein DPEC_G00088650 [Dallia pectoralis]